jgi:putative tryptophan/tyrosine transport system substrate-binding protein
MKTVLLVIAFIFATLHVTGAQQPKKAPRIGYLSVYDPTTESTRIEMFRRALRELGYIEGENILIVPICRGEAR